jgi:hypothetical protein
MNYSNLKNKLLFKFTVFYLVNTLLLMLIVYFNFIKIDLYSVLLLSFFTSFFYILYQIETKVGLNEDLTRSNYWQLKNELNKKLNGGEKRKKNSK